MRALHLAALAVASITARRALADECDPIPVWKAGTSTGVVCRTDAPARGLTIVELSDRWTPAPFDAEPAPRYRATYRALASERFDEAGDDGVLAARDRYLELYGIVPTLGVIRSRLADAARHACHAAIPPAVPPDGPIREESTAAAVARLRLERDLRAELEFDRAKHKLADLDALAATDPYYRRALARLESLTARRAAVETVQAHLACDGLVTDRPLAGGYTWQTSAAVTSGQRGAMLLPTSTLDAATFAAIVDDSRERDFRAGLRVLRERVAAATGLLEDGTAGAGEATVLGRALVPEATWRARGALPIPGAAPDLISEATEAAATALGWRDPETAAQSLAILATTPWVAIALPAPPAYHAPIMDLAIEIDRGDVWYARDREPERRPALVVYALHAGTRTALARWPTTIGGWQAADIGGEIAERWKPSPVGPRVWRDLFVGPVWLPPSSTPDRELVHATDRGYVLARELFGPSYRAAFGILAFVHLLETRVRGEVELVDEGIRTHGTGNVASVASGWSHGCHRLLGLHAVRLASFVLAHRTTIRRGEAPTWYRRIVAFGGRFPIALDSLGDRIELVPPIPVEVLEGHVHR